MLVLLSAATGGYPEDAERYPNVIRTIWHGIRVPSICSVCLSATGHVQRILNLCRWIAMAWNRTAMKMQLQEKTPFHFHKSPQQMAWSRRCRCKSFRQGIPIQSHLHSSNPDPLFTTLRDLHIVALFLWIIIIEWWSSSQTVDSIRLFNYSISFASIYLEEKRVRRVHCLLKVRD